MKDYTNLRIREFRESIVRYMNSVDLPVEVKSMVLREISNATEKTANEQIKREIVERDKAEKEAGDGLPESVQPD